MDLDYCDIEWLALEMNRDHAIIFEIVSKYCILNSFVQKVGERHSAAVLFPLDLSEGAGVVRDLFFLLLL